MGVGSDAGCSPWPTLAEVPDERLHMFIDYQIPYRTLAVQISRADEVRLVRNIAAYNAEVPEDPMNPNHDDDLGVALVGCALRGLEAGDDDAGVWSDLDGTAHALPRPNRSPLHRRALNAWRAAQRSWRSS